MQTTTDSDWMPMPTTTGGSELPASCQPTNLQWARNNRVLEAAVGGIVLWLQHRVRATCACLGASVRRMGTRALPLREALPLYYANVYPFCTTFLTSCLLFTLICNKTDTWLLIKTPFFSFVITDQIIDIPCRKCQTIIFHIGLICHGYVIHIDSITTTMLCYIQIVDERNSKI